MIEALLVQAKKLGVEVFYRTTARHLARENSHGDMSLQATGPEGQALAFDARRRYRTPPWPRISAPFV